MKKNILFTLLIIVLGSFFLFSFTKAQGLNTAGSVFKSIGNQAGADTYTEPEQLIGVIINAALTLVGLIFLILMIYAGYLWLTARGEEEPITKAKKIITSTVIGFVLVASAYSITVFIGGRFEGGSAGGADNSCGSGAYENWSCLNIDTCFDKYKITSEKDTIVAKRLVCENTPSACAVNKCSKAAENIICCKKEEEKPKEVCGEGTLAASSGWGCLDIKTCFQSVNPDYEFGSKTTSQMRTECEQNSSFCRLNTCSDPSSSVICCKY